MHRLFRPLLVLTLLLLVVQVASLWMVEYTSPAGRVNIGLAQGCVRVYIAHSAADVRPVTSAGLGVGGWTGDALLWEPELSGNSRVWVMRPGTSVAVSIVGSVLVLPIAYPLGIAGGLTGAAFVLARRRARLFAGKRCRACGYDVRGLRGDRCPECGGVIAKMVRGVWAAIGWRRGGRVACVRNAAGPG